MTFAPPLDDGLAHGDRTPEEELERHGLTPDTWGQPGVYALRLHQPQAHVTLRQWWYRRHEAKPPVSLMVEARDATACYYVGGAGDLHARIHEHLDAPNRSAAIMAAFPIHSVAAVWPGDGFEHERRRAYGWRDEHPGSFVWCDGEAV